MTLFADPQGLDSLRVRIALAEKGVTARILDIDPGEFPAELAELSPERSLPVLIDRELVLHRPAVIMEYVDERFPHPALLPVAPTARAEARQLMQRIESQWYARAATIADPRGEPAERERARRELLDELLALAPLFGGQPWFRSAEFTLVDCCLAALLWRLPALGVAIPRLPRTLPLHAYMDRVFARPGFRAGLPSTEIPPGPR